jgi:hypothetical protein
MTMINLAAKLIASKRRLDKPCFVGPENALNHARLDCAVRKQAAWLNRQVLAELSNEVLQAGASSRPQEGKTC